VVPARLAVVVVATMNFRPDLPLAATGCSVQLNQAHRFFSAFHEVLTKQRLGGGSFEGSAPCLFFSFLSLYYDDIRKSATNPGRAAGPYTRRPPAHPEAA